MKEHALDPWRRAVEAGELRFPRCEDCGTWNWYPLPCCRSCQSSSFRWVRVEALGRLHSWTRVHHTFGMKVTPTMPYVVGLVEIRDAPGVMLTCLNWQDQSDPRIGAPTRLELERAASGARWTFKHAAE